MNHSIRVLSLSLAVLFIDTGMPAQNQAKPKKSTASQKPTTTPQQFGESYATLRPEQKKLIDDLIRRYNTTTGSKIVAREAYDNARMSVRTTFDAVTHALLMAKMTDARGTSLARGIDVIDAIDDVMGEEVGVGGDRQFRLYVYLKPTAIDILSRSREFERDRDNTVYHKGFPICFRLKNGPPSIQVSISRDRRMADIDVDYRSSSFPKALFNGHLTASNSDVRAGSNLDRHDSRWAGLNGWWREVFGFSLGDNDKPPMEGARNAGAVPLNPRVKSAQGIDESAHDFLQTWVVDKQPNKAVAYFSRRSYSCLEEIAKKDRPTIPPGMVRVRLKMAMDNFNTQMGSISSVEDVFEAVSNWSPELKEAKNSHPREFRLVSVPPDQGQGEECVQAADQGAAKKSKEKYYATAMRRKRGDSPNKVMSLFWAEEGKYWKIVAIHVEDDNDAGLTPKKTEPTRPAERELEKIVGDPKAVKDITNFYQSWLARRDTAKAVRYASERSYPCLAGPSAAEKKMEPMDRLRTGLERPLDRIPKSADLSEMISGVQPVNEMVRPVDHENANAFALMVVPDQMADSFLCQHRHLAEKAPSLNPADAKYGKYYLSASRLNLGEGEESAALLLLWTKEEEQWKVIAWAVEVP